MPADPEARVEVGTADSHCERCPDYGFDVHVSRQMRCSKCSYQPIQPFEVHRPSPLSHADINVVGQPHFSTYRCSNYFSRKQTAGFLPH